VISEKLDGEFVSVGLAVVVAEELAVVVVEGLAVVVVVEGLMLDQCTSAIRRSPV
jgi:hypothetical protein